MGLFGPGGMFPIGDTKKGPKRGHFEGVWGIPQGQGNGDRWIGLVFCIGHCAGVDKPTTTMPMKCKKK